MNTTSLKDGLLSISKEESLAAMEYHAKLENDGTLGETYGYLADKFPAISTALDLENGHYLTDCILGRELLSGMRYVAVVVAIVAELRAEKSFETTILSIPPNALADACRSVASTLTPAASQEMTQKRFVEFPGFYKTFFEETFARTNERKVSMNWFAGVAIALHAFTGAASTD